MLNLLSLNPLAEKYMQALCLGIWSLVSSAVLLYCCSNSTLKASTLMPTSLPSDILEPGHFLENPAGLAGDTMRLGLIGLQKQASHIYEEKRGDSTEFKAKNKTHQTSLGAGIFLDLGDGLGLLVEQVQVQSDEKNTRLDQRSQTLTETFRQRLSKLNVQVELSESLRAGFLLRFLDSDISLLGNYFVSNSERTNFKPSLFGSGGGLHFSRGNAALAMAYILPIKGKTEIYSEEKVISAPGLAKVDLALKSPNAVIAFGLTRWVYKHDDRAFGTTLDNANQSDVNLLGLSRDRNLIFLLEQKQLAGLYHLSAGSRLRGGVSLMTAALNYEPTRYLPGEDSSSARFDYYLVQVGLDITRGRLKFTLGGNRTVDRKFSVNRGGRQRVYNADTDEFYAGVRAEL